MEHLQNTKKIPVIVVVGPTASGKTKLSVDLAKHFDGEIVSADSMQIYRYMDIGTAKASREEQQGIPHHMIDFLDPGVSFSVAEYVDMAGKLVWQIWQKGKPPVVVGGTGLYVDSLMNGTVFEALESDPKLRLSLQHQAQEKGNVFLLEKLAEVDPELAEKLHPNNLGRIIRALEVYRITGISMSEHQRRSRQHPSPYDGCYLGLNFSDRQKLYERINLRVDQMFSNGLVEEVRQLKKAGFGHTAAQAIGYKEIFSYLNGETSLEEAKELVKLQSRRYAKRQLTWFRRNPEIQWLFPDLESSYNALLTKAIALVQSTLKAYM